MDNLKVIINRIYKPLQVFITRNTKPLKITINRVYKPVQIIVYGLMKYFKWNHYPDNLTWDDLDDDLTWHDFIGDDFK